jgi:hypothetical protein
MSYVGQNTGLAQVRQMQKCLTNTYAQTGSNNTFFFQRLCPDEIRDPQSFLSYEGRESYCQQVTKSEPKTDYLDPFTDDIMKPCSHTSIPIHIFGVVSMRRDNFIATFIQHSISFRSNVSNLIWKRWLSNKNIFILSHDGETHWKITTFIRSRSRMCRLSSWRGDSTNTYVKIQQSVTLRRHNSAGSKGRERSDPDGG